MCNVINGPGKFEGEPCYAEAFWETVLEGFSDDAFDDGDTPVDVFKLTDEDRTAHPNCFDPDDAYLLMWESDTGFVYTAVHTAQAYDHVRSCIDPVDTEEE